jgi:hypothetical protein
MKTLMLLLLGSALLATSAFAGVNITINPYEIARTVQEATQSTPGRVYQSKPAATPPAQKKRPKSRSSSTPSPDPSVEAVKSFRRAVEQDDTGGQNNLGIAYIKGEGVAKDQVEAVKWYRKAADQNDPVAQRRLAACFYYGKGIPKNYVECYKWLLLSAAQGDERARKGVPIVERAISPNGIAEGQSLARDFKPGEIPPTGTAVSEANKHQDAAPTARVVSQQPETQPETTATPEATATPQADDSPWHMMNKEQLMAVDEKTLDLAFGMLLKEDTEALAELAMTDKIRISTGNEKVSLEDTNGWIAATKIAVRMKGSSKIWWCNVDALVEKEDKS